MTTEYVDLESEVWTRRLKKIAIAKCIIKFGIFAFHVVFIISMVELFEILTPYVKNKDLVLETAFTNSQITAMMVLLFIAGVCVAFSKMISRIMRK